MELPVYNKKTKKNPIEIVNEFDRRTIQCLIESPFKGTQNTYKFNMKLATESTQSSSFILKV